MSFAPNYREHNDMNDPLSKEEIQALLNNSPFISFMNLKVRAGGPFPAGSNVFCIGWKNTCTTLQDIFGLRHTF